MRNGLLRGSWRCGHCGGRNDRADGPVCQDCGVDAEAPQVGCAERPRARVELPVTAEDFLPAGEAVGDDDRPF